MLNIVLSIVLNPVLIIEGIIADDSYQSPGTRCATVAEQTDPDCPQQKCYLFDSLAGGATLFVAAFLDDQHVIEAQRADLCLSSHLAA